MASYVRFFFVIALLSLRAAGIPITAGDKSDTLRSDRLKFREIRQTIGSRKHLLGLGGDLDHVTSKQHPHLSTIKKLLRDVSSSLTDHGVDHHITAGTLIGWKRNKQIIPVRYCFFKSL